MTSDNPHYRDEWLDAFQEVNSVRAGIAHHLATGHHGSGADQDYVCLVCEFGIERGWVVAGGLIRVLTDA